MIYLTTGANGAGKTLLTLRDVREKSLKENRPVYHNGRFEIVPGGPLESWEKIEFKDWQTVPDGAIFIIDECHNELPVRSGKDVPEWVRMLAEHRRRGFDFYLITQHPNNIDAFVRRLIGAPGWHRHLKRASGAPLVSVLTWPAVNANCEKQGSGESGQTAMVPYPKEVYAWYVSTSLDTAKIKIPFQLKVLVAVVVVLPLLVWFGYSTFKQNQADALKRLEIKNGLEAGAVTTGTQPAQALKVATAADYVESLTPRLDGFPQSAPRYDEITRPTVAPYPAACVQMAARCDCYTQQATRIVVPAGVCAQIVKTGFFMDWQAGPSDQAKPVSQSLADRPSAPTPAQPDFKNSIAVRHAPA